MDSPPQSLCTTNFINLFQNILVITDLFKTNLDPQKASLMTLESLMPARRKPKRWWRNLGGQGLKKFYHDPSRTLKLAVQAFAPKNVGPPKNTDSWVGFFIPYKHQSRKVFIFQLPPFSGASAVSFREGIHPKKDAPPFTKWNSTWKIPKFKKKHQHEPPNHPFG